MASYNVNLHLVYDEKYWDAGEVFKPPQRENYRTFYSR